MRCVIQRVDFAKVVVEQATIGEIEKGLLVLVGFESVDELSDLEWMARKITNMRLFPDGDGVMNQSVSEIDGQVLVVSQFTLHASTKKGNRPSYIRADNPDSAKTKYDLFVSMMQNVLPKKVGSGEFGAMMEVSLLNNGPVTIIVDSRNKE